jgi:ubiquinone/menaquinone biosynthesis C-methylase UbiE
MTLATADENKAAYHGLHDRIIEKRFNASSPIRRHAHHMQYEAFVEIVPAGATVLDAGCGEGVLSVLLAKKGCIVTGVDLSAPNVEAAKAYAAAEGVGEKTTFLVGDVEKLPAADKSFDVVVSSHVLEHLPDFEQGARELARVARTQVVVAIPTCLNLCAMVLLGRDKYWTFSRRTPLALPYGMLRILWAFIRGEEGVNEGYAGRADLIHIWRFPKRGAERLERGGLKVERYRASSHILPYFPFLLPLSRFSEKFVWAPVMRNFGYGTTYVCRPKA